MVLKTFACSVNKPRRKVVSCRIVLARQTGNHFKLPKRLIPSSLSMALLIHKPLRGFNPAMPAHLELVYPW